MSMIKLIDNRYDVLEKLGAGGIGKVYRVYDKVRNKELALKLFFSQSEENLLNLKREFLIMTKLRHPNIVEVYDFILNKKNVSYFTMEYIDGTDFVKATGNLPTMQATGRKKDKYSYLYFLIIQVCQALERMHSQGVVHCDIKPSNILIANNKTAKLLDFGMAQPVDISTPGGMRGTVEYMAPEIIRGNYIDRRADLYSLGVLLYEAVTHKLPFVGETAFSVLKQHLEMEPIPPSKYVKGIPQDLTRIILKLLTKYPYNRYQSAGDVISDISHITGEKVVPDFRQASLDTQKEWLLNGSFVGREKELARLNNLLTENKGVVISITGDFGIGKTRLMEEFRIQAQLNGFGFLMGVCNKEEKGAYEPVIEILNKLVLIANLSTQI